jgi:hypothetical protein
VSNLAGAAVLAVRILEAYDSRPLEPGKWLDGEWLVRSGERLRICQGTMPGAGICRLYDDVLRGVVPWADVPFDWELLRRQGGSALLRTIERARAQLRERRG